MWRITPNLPKRTCRLNEPVTVGLCISFTFLSVCFRNKYQFVHSRGVTYILIVCIIRGCFIFCFLVYVSSNSLIKIWVNTSGADPGFLERGLICIKVWRVWFADFIPFSLNIPWKWNNLVSLRPNYFIFIKYLKTGAGREVQANPLNCHCKCTWANK